jgi:LuxR family transcriptional regulator, maltose regulon positive regulatory protein
MSEPGKAAPSIRILHTKLFIPKTGAELVSRPRLAAALDKVLRHSLILITAPAGSGKTTLICSWLAQAGLPVGWLSLDERDNDPNRFWSYFLSALQTIHPGVGQAAAALLQSPQPPPIEGVLVEVINDSQFIEKDFLLVLDDYHTITSPSIHQGLTYLLENIPQHMHLVIISRTVPELPISQLRVRRKLLELSAADLNFTLQESETYLNGLMQLQLNAQEVATIERLTEGWAAGLHLAALALQTGGREASQLNIQEFARTFAAGHHYLFDYLGQEILERQPASLQEFLLTTAFLEPLTAPLCAAVLGRPTQEAQAALEQIHEANLFLIPLDERRQWFRYHPLFSSFLKKRLESLRSRFELIHLHRLASNWYGEEGLHAEAVECALRAEDYPLAAHWIDLAAEDMFVRSELITLLRWLDSLPKDILAASTRLSIMKAWALLATSRAVEVEPNLQAVEKILGLTLEQAAGVPQINKLPPDIRGALAGVACIRSSLKFGAFQLDEVMRLHEQTLALLSDQETGDVFNRREDLLGVSYFNAALAHEYLGATEEAIDFFTTTISISPENFHLLPLAYSHIAKLQAALGELDRAEASYRQALLSLAQMGHSSPLAGLVHAGLANLLIERNDLEAAQFHLEKGLELGKIWNQGENLAESYSGFVRYLLAHNKPLAAREYLAELAELARSTTAAWLQPTVDLLQALLAARTRDQAGVIAWLNRQPPHPYGLEVSYLHEGAALVHTCVLMAVEQYPQALELSERLINSSQKGHRFGLLIHGRIYQALCLARLGKQEEALSSLEQALLLAGSQGYRRVFLDEGREMESLLLEYQAAHPTGPAAAYTGDLLESFAPAGPVPSREEHPAYHPLLTEREMEVLKLLASGSSNQQISQRLYISLNTVKTHVKNILAGLGVENRTQAAARARDLGLL